MTLLDRAELAEDVLRAAVRLLGCTLSADTPEGTVSVRLVAVSGYSSPQDHADARGAGFECLLTKPLTRKSLRFITHGQEL